MVTERELTCGSKHMIQYTDVCIRLAKKFIFFMFDGFSSD